MLVRSNIGLKVRPTSQPQHGKITSSAWKENSLSMERTQPQHGNKTASAWKENRQPQHGKKTASNAISILLVFCRTGFCGHWHYCILFIESRVVAADNSEINGCQWLWYYRPWKFQEYCLVCKVSFIKAGISSYLNGLRLICNGVHFLCKHIILLAEIWPN